MGLFGDLLGGLFGASGASANRRAAEEFSQNAKFDPYNINANGTTVNFNGNTATASLSPILQSIQQGLFGNASGILGGASDTVGSGGINPFLASILSNYQNNQKMPPISFFGDGGQFQNQALGAQGLAGQSLLGAANPNQYNSGGIGDAFNSQAGGFLSQLGSFNPNQLASDYTNKLRATAAPGEQRFANSAITELFNRGRLGTTGGAQAIGELQQVQDQADLQRQLAGMNYAGSEQSRMAGLAGNFGQLGQGINQNTFQLNDAARSSALDRYINATGAAQGADAFGFNRLLGLSDYGNQQNQQLFSNAMQIFGGGQTNLGNTLTAGLGLLGAGTGLDSQLMNAIGLGGTLGQAKSSANAAAFAPLMQAQVAQNNQRTGFLSGLTNSLFGGFSFPKLFGG